MKITEGDPRVQFVLERMKRNFVVRATEQSLLLGLSQPHIEPDAPIWSSLLIAFAIEVVSAQVNGFREMDRAQTT